MQSLCKSIWEKNPCGVALAFAMVFYFLVAPFKPAGDMYLAELTAETIINTNFSDYYIVHEKGPAQAIVDNKVYMVVTRDISLFYAALYKLIDSGGGLVFLLLAVGALLFYRQYFWAACLLVSSAFLVVHWRIAGNLLHSLMVVSQAMMAAGCVFVACKTVRLLGCPKDWLLLVLAGIVFGSFFSISAKAYNRDVYYMLPCLAAIYLTFSKKHIAAALCLACAIFFRHEIVFPLLFCYAIYFVVLGMQESKPLRAAVRALLPYVLITALAMIVTVVINYRNFLITASYVAYMQNWFNIDALYGLILSPGKGLFFYFPVAMYILFKVLSARKFQPESKFLLSIVIVYWLYISIAGPWYGGWCWGPRYISISIFALTYLAVLHADVLSKKVLTRFIVAGILINVPTLLLDAGVNMPYYYEINKERIEAVVNVPGSPDFVHDFKELSDSIFEPRFSPIVLQYETFGKWILRKRGAPYFDVMARFLLTGGQ